MTMNNVVILDQQLKPTKQTQPQKREKCPEIETDNKIELARLIYYEGHDHILPSQAGCGRHHIL